MKSPTRLLVTLFAASLLVAGCGKKKDESADGATPEAVSSRENDGTKPNATGGEGREAAPVTSAADLGATDVAYEAWFKKYHLDLNDPKMLDADTDGDGYTNREEFLADTNPRDPESRPGVHPAIRLKEFTEVRVPFMLRSVDGETAKIEHADGGEGKVETVRAGQPLKGSPYKVQKVESLMTQDKDGNPIDASKVTLEDTASAQKVDLVKDMPTRSSASYAALTSADGRTSITVKQGEIFEWPGEKDVHYKVVDLRNDQVILEQIENKKMWTVPKK